MMKKAQITLTTDPRIKRQDEIYFKRMGLSLSSAINTLLYKVYYNGGKLPYNLASPQHVVKADTDRDINHYIDEINHGNHGEKHHLIEP